LTLSRATVPLSRLYPNVGSAAVRMLNVSQCGISSGTNAECCGCCSTDSFWLSKALTLSRATVPLSRLVSQCGISSGTNAECCGCCSTDIFWLSKALTLSSATVPLSRSYKVRTMIDTAGLERVSRAKQGAFRTSGTSWTFLDGCQGRRR
jgi:hypothetical protein